MKLNAYDLEKRTIEKRHITLSSFMVFFLCYTVIEVYKNQYMYIYVLLVTSFQRTLSHTCILI